MVAKFMTDPKEIAIGKKNAGAENVKHEYYVSQAKHRYEVVYSPVDLGAVGPPPPEVPETDIFDKSLLERAGLDKGRAAKMKTRRDWDKQSSFEVTDDSAGQLRRVLYRCP